MKKSFVAHHGDVLIMKVSDSTELPVGYEELTPEGGRNVLQHGEALGHYHVTPVDNNKIRVFLHPTSNDVQRNLTLIVNQPVPVTHEEHKTVILEPGRYISKSKREWRDGMPQPVID